MAQKSSKNQNLEKRTLQSTNVHLRNRKAADERSSIEEQRLFIGPIPPAEELAELKIIDPLFPDRILKLAEEEAKHRRDEVRKNNRVMRAEIRSDGIIRFVAPFMAFLLSGAILYLAFIAFEKGLEWAGTIISLPSIAGLIFGFYNFTKTRRNH